ncbi:MAG: hypothetical protein ACT4QC_21535 [Planctomycetaceae bacterium]
MLHTHAVTRSARRLLIGLACLAATAAYAQAQTDDFSSTRIRRPDPPNLSEATAILEAAVRSLYATIEPSSNNTSPNELLAYADLRSLRLYSGALEVAGWALEQSADDYNRYDRSGAYRAGRGRVNDTNALLALERFRACRETVRTLLQRVRTTAVLAEHQISFCDIQVGRQWRQEVLPALRETIAATDPVFEEEVVYQRYGVPGQTATIIQAGGTGIPEEAVEVGRYPTYQPYEGQGRGRGRYFEIRAFGGAVRVVAIRFKSHENAFGLVGTSTTREITINQTVQPGEPLFIPCNRQRWVDVSELEIEWEPAQRGRKVYGLIELAESTGDERN